MQDKLRPAEVPEARCIVGKALIEENEALHEETASLLDILRIYSEEVDSKVQQNAWRARLSRRDAKREMLEGEIRAFVAALRSKTSTPLSLRARSARQEVIISYVSGETVQGGGGRLTSARDILGSRGGTAQQVGGLLSHTAHLSCPSFVKNVCGVRPDVCRTEERFD